MRSCWLAATAALVVILVTTRAETILKGRVIESLSARFHGPVQLSEFHVSVRNGFQVSGGELKIFGPDDPDSSLAGVQPLIAIREFDFSANILNLLHAPTRIHQVYIKGLELDIPPREQRKGGGFKGGKIKIYVDEFICEQAPLVINTLPPGKLPVEFDIGNLQMKEIGPGQPLLFNATLVNPKPVGAFNQRVALVLGTQTIHGILR